MKVILFVALFSFLLLCVPLGNVSGQTSQKLPLAFDITNIQRVPLETADLIIFDLIITNEGNATYQFWTNGLALYDSERRIFEIISPSDVSDQQGVGFFDVPCDLITMEDIQPDVPTPLRDICFLVPQDRSLSYGFVIAESNYEYCSSTNQFLKQECRAQEIGKISLTSTEVEEVTSSDGGGCLIATATYGSELTDEVQNLREIRNKMYETETGSELMKSVNEFYYSFSPTVSDWERENPILRESVKLLITPAMISFTVLDHEGISSDQDLINYVVSITFLNIGMYFVAPAVLIMKVRKRI